MSCLPYPIEARQVDGVGGECFAHSTLMGGSQLARVELELILKQDERGSKSERVAKGPQRTFLVG